MRRVLMILWVCCAVLWGPGVAAAKPPVVDAAAQAEAGRIQAMPSGDPAARMRMLLASRDLGDAALFALAGTAPGIVEQLVKDDYRPFIDYIAQLPPGDLHRVRTGDTVIRTPSSMTPSERKRLDALIERYGFPPKKFKAIRIGPLEGRIYKIDVTFQVKRRKTETRSVELAWPFTPERDEKSRDFLAKHYGARPSKSALGAGASLPLEDGSFEDPSSLGTHWSKIQGKMFGLEVPVSDLIIDNSAALDGRRSLRFHGSDDTRLFWAVSQQTTVVSGMQIRASAMIKADNLRVEFQQSGQDVYMALQYLDIYGNPVGPAEKANARLGTHPWENLAIDSTVPPGADLVRLELHCSVSGTAWFDGVTLELR